MNRDLTPLLNEWPHEPGKLTVRFVSSRNGERLIQIRLELGILQMHADGRPDGQQPHGFPSLLEYHESRLDAAAEDGAERALSLTPEECQALRDEAVQFYHRYVALLALEEFEGVIRDTTRNLRVLDLCARHAEQESDRTALEQFRPYILMVRARAMASQALKDNEPKAAVLAIDQALATLQKYFADTGRSDSFEQSGEVQMLRGMREALVPKLPVSQKAELKRRLSRALEQENYRLAAILRDELKLMGE